MLKKKISAKPRVHVSRKNARYEEQKFQVTPLEVLKEVARWTKVVSIAMDEDGEWRIGRTKLAQVEHGWYSPALTISVIPGLLPKAKDWRKSLVVLDD